MYTMRNIANNWLIQCHIFLVYAVQSRTEVVFSLAYLRHIGPTSLQYRVPFDVGMGLTQSFDMATTSTYTMPSYHALNFAWGEHCEGSKTNATST